MQNLNRILCFGEHFLVNQRRFLFKRVKRPALTKEVKSKFAAQTESEYNVSIAKVLTTKISAAGPITVAEYMKHVLTNPNVGYYMLKDVFGEKGDFITSPEIGQIFGELVALWCLCEWDKCGKVEPFQIVELGPGRGTLCQDIIRVLANFHLSEKFTLHLVEVSPHLSELQAKRLCCKYTDTPEADVDKVPYYRKGETLSGIQVYWYRQVSQIPKSFSIFLAHEFLDVLPIHKFQRVDDKWKEVLIDIDRSKEDSFKFVLSEGITPNLGIFLTRPWVKKLELANHVEYSIEAEQTIDTIGQHIKECGGFSLIMDYGHFNEQRDTFRAFKKHGLHEPLVEPGTADLTADVDFAFVKAIAEQSDNLITFGPVLQQEFLDRMGGKLRLEKLIENAKSDNDVRLLQKTYHMLTHPDKMGTRFKFFSIFPKVLEEHLKKYPVFGFHEPPSPPAS